MILSFKGITLEVQLKQQSDLIHFQFEGKSTTLRASEVKPKLDRYLLKKAKDCLTDRCYVDKRRNALNYKMRFVETRASELKARSRYDNKLQKDCKTVNFELDKFDKRYKINTNPKLMIICLIPELQEIISAHLEAFFIVTNFGFLQGKGYGSFLIADSKLTGNAIKTILKDEFSLPFLYAINCQKYKTKTFDIIKNFYQLTKSGYNFSGKYAKSALFEYMHSIGIGNEKAELKQRGIIRPVGTFKKPYYRKNVNPKYIRTLLGIADNYTFRDPITKSTQKVSITPDHHSGIERYPSPIFFKIINDLIYIIPIWDKERKIILNQSFTFTNIKSKEKIVLRVPDEFNLYDFLESAVNYYNREKGNLPFIGENIEKV